MEEELRALLLADAGIAGLVEDRIDWGERPQGARYPAIVLNVITNIEGYHMNGRNGLFEGRVQVDCYGLTYKAAKALSRAVTSLLHCHRAGGFRLITHVASREDREGGSNEAERPYRVGLDFLTAWKAE